MKKILFGSAAAICAVAGFSSFKTAHKFTTYYFQVNTGLNKVKGTAAIFQTNQVVGIGSDPGGCSDNPGTGYDCVVTFTSHVNAAGTKITLAQKAAHTVYTRATY